MGQRNSRPVRMTLGTDRRQQYASRRLEERNDTEEAIERRMAQRIQAAHCRLLERATDGRLTWEEDQIVHTNSQVDHGQARISARPPACPLTANTEHLIVRPAEPKAEQAGRLIRILKKTRAFDCSFSP